MTKTEIILSLIADEREAIKGYEDAIKAFEGDEAHTEAFNAIIADEAEHIKVLTDLF